MKNILQEYIPFEHDNLEYINNLIAFARSQKSKKTSEGAIASVVIYSNLAEYLAGNLVKNMRHMIYLVSYFQLQGILFIKSTEEKSNPKTLGQLKNDLSNYEFPDKGDFLKLINELNIKRNNLLHRLMTPKNEKGINELDTDIEIMQIKAEEMLQKYNVITEGLKSIWSKITTVQPIEEKTI